MQITKALYKLQVKISDQRYELTESSRKRLTKSINKNKSKVKAYLDNKILSKEFRQKHMSYSDNKDKLKVCTKICNLHLRGI